MQELVRCARVSLSFLDSHSLARNDKLLLSLDTLTPFIFSELFMKFYYVDILRCADDSYSTGVTNNLALRFQQHSEGGAMKTAIHFPVGL
jgi:hypothetical protein